jgi:hypothetical protein
MYASSGRRSRRRLRPLHREPDMLMRLTPGDDLPTTLGRKVEPVEITFDLGCDEPVRWVEHPAAGFTDRKHPSAPKRECVVTVQGRGVEIVWTAGDDYSLSASDYTLSIMRLHRAIAGMEELLS